MRGLKIVACPAAIALASLLVIALPNNAWALSQQASEFLVSISIDPASEGVKQADQDGTITTVVGGDPEVNSLELLASKKKKNGARCFIDTRTDIHRLKADYTHTEAAMNAGPLQACAPRLYLTVEEQELMVKKIWNLSGKNDWAVHVASMG